MMPSGALATVLTEDTPVGRPVRECAGVTPETFRTEILPAAQPVVMRGAVEHWPAVAAARRSDDAVARYLADLDTGEPVDAMVGPSAMKGHFFFTDDLSGVNFGRTQQPVSAILAAILDGARRPSGERNTVYVGAARAGRALPGFAEGNTLSLVPDGLEQRICLGGPVTVQAHFDLLQNVACLVAGRRRFTLFPPAQLKNLYLAPIERSLAGPPCSLVKPEDPDFERFPRFAEALDHALYAELEPGDALFVPYFWWHHVQSFAPLNLLVNYWWNDPAHELGSPLNAMLHTLLTVRDLPPPMRDAWKAMFDHFIFEHSANSSPVAHIPQDAQGGLGPHDDTMRAQLWSMLASVTAQQAREAGEKAKGDR